MVVHLNIELTDHCNLQCTMCSQTLRPWGHGASGGFMARETWEGILDGLASGSDEIHLCPHWLGEPTLHPQFEPLLTHAFSRNANNRLFRSFKLHTNGVLLPRARALLLVRLANLPDQAEDTFSSVHFSIDAASAPVYRALKGRDLLPQVQKNVEEFLRIRQDAGARWPRAHLAFVVQPQNRHEVTSFVRRWGRSLDRHGGDWRLAADWPDSRQDAIYVRALNAADQEAADELHRGACRELGLTDAGPGRGKGSF